MARHGTMAVPALSGTGLASTWIDSVKVEVLGLLGRFYGCQEDHPALHELRSKCSRAFEQSSRSEQLLLEIWNTAFPAEPMHVMTMGNHWKRLGFQAANPFTDIRAGQLGPLQLHFFASKYPAQLQQLAEEARDSDYPFACSCFNISYIIAVFFKFYKKPTMNPVSGAQNASRTQLNNFARLCNVSPESAQTVLDELFCTLVKQLHETWKRMRATGECSIMDFSSALREVHASNAVFWQSGHDSLADLKDLSASHPHGQLDSTRFATRLRTLIDGSIKDILHAMDACILKAVTLFESIVAGQGHKMLANRDDEARPDLVRFGTYVPPVVTLARPAEESSLRRSWLAKPINDPDLDLFFEKSACDCRMSLVAEAMEASVSPSALLQDVGVEGSTKPRFSREGVMVPADADSAPHTLTHFPLGSRPPDASMEHVPTARPHDALDPDTFFRNWGVIDSDPAPAKPAHRESQHFEHHRLICSSNMKDLDVFLEKCLGPPQCVAA